jgi:hypothetical protein
MDGHELFSKVSSAYYQETFGNLNTLMSFGRSRRTARVLRTLERLIKPASVVADIGVGPLSSPLQSWRRAPSTSASTRIPKCTA